MRTTLGTALGQPLYRAATSDVARQQIIARYHQQTDDHAADEKWQHLAPFPPLRRRAAFLYSPAHHELGSARDEEIRRPRERRRNFLARHSIPDFLTLFGLHGIIGVYS